MDILQEMSKIDAYLFKYKPEIQQRYAGELGIDDKEHVGVMAQELQASPLTESTVEMNDDGLLTVDTTKLVMVLTAVCSELSKRVEQLENVISEIKNSEV